MAMMWTVLLEGSLGAGWAVIFFGGPQQSLGWCSCVGRALSWRWDVGLQEEGSCQCSFTAVLGNVDWCTKNILLLARTSGLLLTQLLGWSLWVPPCNPGWRNHLCWLKVEWSCVGQEHAQRSSGSWYLQSSSWNNMRDRALSLPALLKLLAICSV